MNAVQKLQNEISLALNNYYAERLSEEVKKGVERTKKLKESNDKSNN